MYVETVNTLRPKQCIVCCVSFRHCDTDIKADNALNQGFSLVLAQSEKSFQKLRIGAFHLLTLQLSFALNVLEILQYQHK